MRASRFFVSLLYLSSASLSAQTTTSSSCVDVSVNDRPALSYACLNQRLDTTSTASTPSLAVDAVTRAPGNQQAGQYNFSALSHRMGDNLGKSAVPQRPPAAPPPPLLGVPVGTH